MGRWRVKRILQLFLADLVPAGKQGWCSFLPFCKSVRHELHGNLVNARYLADRKRTS
jgi:hypothetical protein